MKGPTTGYRRLRTGLLSLLVAAGCATYSVTVIDMEHRLAAGDPNGALQLLEKQSRFNRDDALYYLNKAMFLRMEANYEASNTAFEAAKQEIDKRDAVSVTEQTGTLLINESLKSFVGEDFERALIHLYSALNYLQLGQPYEARVEALQVDLFLEALSKKKSDERHSYTEDAFCRYLAGMIYEHLEEWSDALISYRKAFEAYTKYESLYGIETPDDLKASLLRLTEQQGLSDEHAQFKKKFADVSWQHFNEWRQQGEIVVLLHNGLAPIKHSRVARLPAPQAGQLISVALPEYQRRLNSVERASFEVDKYKLDAVPVESVEDIAIRGLDERMPGLTAKAIARASLKYNITKRSYQEGGDLAGIFANIAAAATEVADTRTWFSLPSQIYMARVALPPGEYQPILRLQGRGGGTLDKKEFGSVKVSKGRKLFLEHYWSGYAAPVTTRRG